MVQIDFFLLGGVKGGQQCHWLIVFLGGGIGEGIIANATGKAEPNHQCCRSIPFFGHCVEGGQQCHRLIVVLGGCCVKGVNVANATGNLCHCLHCFCVHVLVLIVVVAVTNLVLLLLPFLVLLLLLSSLLLYNLLWLFLYCS